MESVRSCVQNALINMDQRDQLDMILNGGQPSHPHHHRYIIHVDGSDHSNLVETNHSQLIHNHGAGLAHQMDDQSQRRQMILNSEAGPSNRIEPPRLQVDQNRVVATTIQSVIYPDDSHLYQRSSNRQIIQSYSLNNEAELSNQQNDDVISISSGASTTMYDSTASTVSLDLAALYDGNQLMDSIDPNDSGIDSDDDSDRMSQFIEVDYIIHEFSPLHQEFLMPMNPPSSRHPLSNPHLIAMRAPTTHPISNQNLRQNLEPFVSPLLSVAPFDPLIENDVQPPPLPPRRSPNVNTNRNNGDNFRCVICMEPVIGNDPHATPCGHTICHADLTEWLNRHEATTCPYCREPISYAECVRLYVI